MEHVDKQSVQRAIKAFRCLPFNYNFYADAQLQGLNAKQVFLQKNEYQVIGEKWFKSSSSLEAAFRWLIVIGILRREVDGQGLTSRIRLTPLGRQIIQENPELPSQRASLIEQLTNCFNKKWPLW